MKGASDSRLLRLLNGQRIMDAMLDVQHASAHEAMNHILWQMRRFAGLNDRTDDTTLVCIAAL